MGISRRHLIRALEVFQARFNAAVKFYGGGAGSDNDVGEVDIINSALQEQGAWLNAVSVEPEHWELPSGGGSGAGSSFRAYALQVPKGSLVIIEDFAWRVLVARDCAQFPPRPETVLTAFKMLLQMPDFSRQPAMSPRSLELHYSLRSVASRVLRLLHGKFSAAPRSCCLNNNGHTSPCPNAANKHVLAVNVEERDAVWTGYNRQPLDALGRSLTMDHRRATTSCGP